MTNTILTVPHSLVVVLQWWINYSQDNINNIMTINIDYLGIFHSVELWTNYLMDIKCIIPFLQSIMKNLVLLYWTRMNSIKSKMHYLMIKFWQGLLSFKHSYIVKQSYNTMHIENHWHEQSITNKDLLCMYTQFIAKSMTSINDSKAESQTKNLWIIQTGIKTWTMPVSHKT